MYVSSSFEGPTVAIAQKAGPKGLPAEGPGVFERFEPLAAALEERGVSTVVLDGKADNVPDTPTFKRYYELTPTRNSDSGLVLRKPEQPIVVHAAYDRTGGIARFVPEVPALNPRGIRNLVASKAEQYAALTGLGAAMPLSRTVHATESSITRAFDELEVPLLILKADKDPDKKIPILVGTKDRLAKDLWKLLVAVGPDAHILIQEAMPEVDEPFNHELRFNKREDALVRAAAQRAREIRVHVIDEQIVAAHGRVGLSGSNREGDAWVFFEQDSLPVYVGNLVLQGTRLLREQTGEQNSYLAWDLTPDGTRVVEVNGRAIGTMKPDPRRRGAQEVHTRIKAALADKLAAMARDSLLHQRLAAV